MFICAAAIDKAAQPRTTVHADRAWKNVFLILRKNFCRFLSLSSLFLVVAKNSRRGWEVRLPAMEDVASLQTRLAALKSESDSLDAAMEGPMATGAVGSYDRGRTLTSARSYSSMSQQPGDISGRKRVSLIR